MLLHPAYKLTIGDQIVDTTNDPQASTAVSIVVALDMDVPADRFTFVLGQVGSFRPERDDDARIELGFADNELTQIMAGKVLSVQAGLTERRVTGHSPMQALLHAYTSETFLAMTAGQIIRALADKAGVTVAQAEDGITFPAYVIHGRTSLYRHMRDLAELCGFDLYCNAAGELIFAPFQRANTIHIFDYGKQIIELEMTETPPAATSVQAWGESPGGNQVAEAWAWLSKDFSGLKGTAGSEGELLLLERPALRTAAAAQAAALAAHTGIQRRALRGTLLSTGQPKVQLGDAVQLRNLPAGHLNGAYQVRSVTHRIDKNSGFTSRIGFQAIEVAL